jgi:hypothetical protein
VLEELRTMGVGLAIDDFGTGFSSLVQLQRLPVDEIKIDRSFVSAMIASESDAAIVRSTIDLARNLGLRSPPRASRTTPPAAARADGLRPRAGLRALPPAAARRAAPASSARRRSCSLPSPRSDEGDDMRRLAIPLADAGAGPRRRPGAAAAPYVVTLADGADVDAVVRDARLPSPKLTYDAALTGFAADLNGPQLERVLADPP